MQQCSTKFKKRRKINEQKRKQLDTNKSETGNNSWNEICRTSVQFTCSDQSKVNVILESVPVTGVSSTECSHTLYIDKHNVYTLQVKGKYTN